MNIFATHPDPERSAADLDDARVVKMLTETCQLLSWAWHLGMARSSGPTPDFPHYGIIYGPPLGGRASHPATEWACASRQNFRWLVDHAVALANEYQMRYPRGTHGAVRVAWAFLAGREYLGELFPDEPWYAETGWSDAPFYDGAANLSLGLDFRGHEDGVHAGYRAYLNARYALSTRRSAPRWTAPASKPAWVLS